MRPAGVSRFGVCSGMSFTSPDHPARRIPRVIGKARGRRQEPGIPREWNAWVLDSHPSAFRPDPLPGYAWLQFADRVREVHRQWLEFGYEPPGVALTDEELALLRQIAAADEPVMLQAEGGSIPAHHAFDQQVDVLRDLWRAGWIVLAVWVAEKGAGAMRAGGLAPPRPTVRNQGGRRWNSSEGSGAEVIGRTAGRSSA